MNLGTLGAVLKFALTLEANAKAFYESSLSIINNLELKKIFEKILLDSDKSIKRLKRVRRENTTEMILEPIEGFDSKPYDFESQIIEENSEDSLINQAKTIETKTSDFYNKASEKVNFLSEISYIFEQLAEKHMKNLTEF